MFGQHIESEQSADLKEAIVISSKRLQPQREARRSEKQLLAYKTIVAKLSRGIEVGTSKNLSSRQ